MSGASGEPLMSFQARRSMGPAWATSSSQNSAPRTTIEVQVFGCRHVGPRARPSQTPNSCSRSRGDHRKLYMWREGVDDAGGTGLLGFDLERFPGELRRPVPRRRNGTGSLAWLFNRNRQILDGRAPLGDVKSQGFDCAFGTGVLDVVHLTGGGSERPPGFDRHFWHTLHLHDNGAV